MSDPIGVGDIVECIASAGGSHSRIRAGTLYCVRALVPTYGCRYCDAYEHDGLSLTTDASDDDGWCPKRFVPRKRRDEAFLASLLSDTPTDVPVEA